MDHIKPRIVASKCLGFAHCRWNGETIPSETMRLLEPYTEIITVCPEVEVGLGVPRDPVRVIGVNRDERKLFQTASGLYFTEEMNQFSKRFLNNLPPIDGFVLKAKSPSCGVRDVKIYPREGKVAVVKQDYGQFGGAVLDAFPGTAVEDEARLTNFRIREHFLTKLFTISRFRHLKEAYSVKKMVHFHARHKLIFMAYNQSKMREMGKIVAAQDQYETEQLLSLYFDLLLKVFEKIPRIGSHVNVLEHAFGYFSKRIGDDERHYLLNTFGEYRKGLFPLSVPLAIVKSHILRFSLDYLAGQYYFDPYPSGLIQLGDSGKGRKLKS